VKRLRERLKLSQEGLGRLIGVSFQTVYLWEAGKVVPAATREATKRLMEVLDQLEIWTEEENILENPEEERIRAWQERIFAKSKRLKDKESEGN